MTPKASRRLLFFAIAVSVVLHVLFAGWFRTPLALRQEQSTTVTTITHARVTRISRATPQPPRTPAPQPSPSARGSAPPRPLATSGHGVSSARTPAPPTPAPVPTATALAQACKTPNAPAGLTATPQPAEIPAEARAAATNGSTVVLVHVNADGSIGSAAVSSTSGNGPLDLVALTMAKGATYAPAYSKCKAAAADFSFEAKWVAW